MHCRGCVCCLVWNRYSSCRQAIEKKGWNEVGVNKEKLRPTSLSISHTNEDKVGPSPQRCTRCSLPGCGEANRGGDPSAAPHQHWGPQLKDRVREPHSAWRPAPTSRASKLAAPWFPPPKPYTFLLCPSLTKNHTRGLCEKGILGITVPV